jgi:hypothetical protein
MSVTLILPCAGKSSRFSKTRPKWMLTHPNGNLMVMESIYGLNLDYVSKILITVVKEHIVENKINIKKVQQAIANVTGKPTDFIVLNTFTSSQSDTVYQTLLHADVKGPIFVKDCDNYFNGIVTDGNKLCISTLELGINAVNKSYVTHNKYGFISGIVEKQVISDKFCVGGYSFKDAHFFKNAFDSINQIDGINRKEVYISHIIEKLLLDGESFESQMVNNYCDWGTSEDWARYRAQFRTLFVDLDGTLVYNSSEYFDPGTGNTDGLTNNIAKLNALYDAGKTRIILTTSRKEGLETEQQLTRLGIKYHQIIFGLPHSQRVIINDYSNTNPYPSALAICLKRDEDNLGDLL